MRGRSDHRREVVVVAAALALAGLTALGLARMGAGEFVRLTGFGRTASAQPDRGVGPVLPGETVIPMPNQMPGERPDRWLLPPDPGLQPVLEAEGTLETIDGTEVVLGGRPGPGAAVGAPGLAIELVDDTTYYVEGRPTTFDQVPEGVPARVTYELEGDRRVALRVEVPEGERAPPLPEAVP